ncbi:MAG TPA: OsmC family protein [Caldisericia bacterium]|nr:OsmC family protein [Caldisericia bacterium]HPF48853.1 OsmC family protein [Caldisericia bacterium]HPI83283.1 OsmC family protein [Caldisericia bacterium]HPQ92510.1 OsmC family protein [Caldisericia bacterium]HRV74392.1 OsmC family protein [Caldisericia bacterium]
MQRKIFEYNVGVDWETEHQGFLTGDFKTVSIACPPEFGGPGKIISPEDLFVASAAVCVMTTFLDFAEKLKINLVLYKSKANGKMEFIDGYYRFSKITIEPEIVVSNESEIEKTERLLRKAENVCPVGKSVTCEVEVVPTITAKG